jgi:RND family efflux transporter MFP subunit
LADVNKAKAQVAISQLNYDRMEDAKKRGVASQQDFDTAKAEWDKSLATLAGANAALETSSLNLEWCEVTSPIKGRVSRKIVTIGNLVTSGGGPAPATLLTTIQSVDPIYCNIDVDEQSILKYQILAAEKKRAHERDGKVPCFVHLVGEVGPPHEGRIDFVDNRLDPSTGTLRMRALVPNESGNLTPGNYARVRIPGSGRYKALLVPDAAIGNDQSHKTVLVINQANIVEPRIVQIGALFGHLRAIKSGLSENDKVIVNGQMKAFPGAPVTPTESTLQFDLSSITP